MWKCYECGAEGNPSGFAATTRELDAHLSASTHVKRFHAGDTEHVWPCKHGYYTYGGAKGDRTKVEVGPHLLYGQDIVESSAWERIKEGVKEATGGFFLGVGDKDGGPFGSSVGKAPAVSQLDLVKQRYTVLDVFQETHDTVTIFSDFPAEWSPGQFSMLGTAATGEVPISFSGKRDGCTMQTIRNVGRVTSVLAEMRTGATITQRGPFGHGWQYKDAKKLLIIAGGCGMAPLMPVLDDRPDAVVLYGVKGANDFYDLSAWHNVHCITEEDGYVTDLISMFNVDGLTVLICGPEIMMRAAAKKLMGFGMDPARIQVSLERYMTCGIGLCERCSCGKGRLVCKDGPVFTYAELLA